MREWLVEIEQVLLDVKSYPPDAHVSLTVGNLRALMARLKVAEATMAAYEDYEANVIDEYEKWEMTKSEEA